jgi:hypothetical protein
MKDAAMLPLYEKRKLEGWLWNRAMAQAQWRARPDEDHE